MLPSINSPCGPRKWTEKVPRVGRIPSVIQGSRKFLNAAHIYGDDDALAFVGGPQFVATRYEYWPMIVNPSHTSVPRSRMGSGHIFRCRCCEPRGDCSAQSCLDIWN
ncbi:hypothetical protein CYMTET_3959 [Cymbomonas tetramitiformis]|uniref:Uncharacterized protein n=1 Tax=Cymbomonas tetramitiformis TaxID=36881 RepID=A0AAE0H234_9CHLO|nr:hypothetical protein CYMTET_3959 [Cymbomonas tetramitiformis]